MVGSDEEHQVAANHCLRGFRVSHLPLYIRRGFTGATDCEIVHIRPARPVAVMVGVQGHLVDDCHETTRNGVNIPVSRFAISENFR